MPFAAMKAENASLVRHQFLALRSRLECPRTSRDVIMLDVDNVHSLDCGPFDGSINTVDDVSIVLGDVILYVDNDKCFIVHHLLNHKTAWIEITIETAVGGGELQNAVVRVGYTSHTY